MPEKGHKGPVENYLDHEKSVIISAPAGSGKTEKLARRYIALLLEGSDMQRILCITFTEKAAAEMKERILRILSDEYPALLSTLLPKTPDMRISTIHSFCLKILKRFSIELGLDPSLSIMDEHRARDLWNEAMFDTLISERKSEGIMYSIMRDRGIRGWGPLKRHLDMLSLKAPLPEILLLSDAPGSAIEGDKEEGIRLLTAYARCLARYGELKAEHHLLDFNDLEILASRALNTVPNAHDILFSFDEHTDHILVDEFQDTSSLQWTIIDKLTEEWRSGRGPKRELGKTPTVFLVGDEKQSIYLFRGANVAMFSQARERFDLWLKEKYHYIEAEDNYRCLPEIVEFTNRLFGHIMDTRASADGHGVKYSHFEARREGKGFVGLLLTQPGQYKRQTRAIEADLMASHIRSLTGVHMVYGPDGIERPARHEDMAILIKKRTHLSVYEDALRREGVPFIVVKGIGFFHEPEVSLLMELINFITDPGAPYPLFSLLRSPMFGLRYEEIMRLKGNDNKPLMNALRDSEDHREIYSMLMESLGARGERPLAILLEDTLNRTGTWEHMGNKQRRANVRKFISLVEDYESEGLSPIEIREKLLRLQASPNTPKANISSEGMDAVRIMTIHAAKGLQFPMVFLPGMEESLGSRSEPIVFDDSGPVPRMGFEEDNKKRKNLPIFIADKLKHDEEEKRLFYVAVTRARDYLLMSGANGEKPTGRLGYLEDAFNAMSSPHPDIPLTLLGPEEIKSPGSSGTQRVPQKGLEDIPVHVEPLTHSPLKIWEDVTHDDDDPQARAHGQGRTVIGTVIHKLLEGISRGEIDLGMINERAESLIRHEGGSPSLMGAVLDGIKTLRESPLWDEVVMPAENSYTELPFVLDTGGTVYRGRIDRVLIRDGEVLVYDYKTFPVADDELAGVLDKYANQMGLYREAASKICKLPARAMLVLTERAETHETG